MMQFHLVKHHTTTLSTQPPTPSPLQTTPASSSGPSLGLSFQSDGEVFTILYVGVVASGIAFVVQIWCIDRGGPVFVAVYQLVQTLVVAIMASIALGEEFYLDPETFGDN
ncbi:hypothetical protein QN277_016574 [Acacia crassicarpa]|uniref:WAT1-related protein n=1 Tax=Acacia crassicarpa TaxID=499986 RepID=A0AAE1MX35_9FABA|nr:hypothetical protein QN277_016574 [Acacia crassicarpa]